MTNQPDHREASIRIRLSDSEKERLAELAWQARKSVSAYVRDELRLSGEVQKNAMWDEKR